MEVVEISKQIQDKIAYLDKGMKLIQERANFKAETAAHYDKKLAIVLIKLKNGQPIGIDENVIEKPPASIMDKVAKGVCWQEKLNMEQAEAEYKLTITKIDVIKAQLTAFQSLYRHLDLT